MLAPGSGGRYCVDSMDSLGTIPSQRFGRYELLSRVGEGGMAEIFRAEVVDELGEIETAILKLQRDDADSEIQGLFELEADLMNLLDHPNLVARLEVGVAGGRSFIAMEDLYGGDLRTLMNSHHKTHDGVPLDKTLHIVGDVLRGLAYFHQAASATGTPLELIHGDVNPSNVFLSVDGAVKLGDFGVATAAGIGSGLELPPGVAMGKKHYLAPEILAGEGRSASADLFAVGVMLYELVVGYRPFDGESDQEIFQALADTKLEIPPGLVDPPMKQILRRALAHTPKARFPTAGALCGALIRYQLDEGHQLGPGAFTAYLSEMLGVIA